MVLESQENFGEVKQVFKTEELEGPLDLLLYQIQKAEINIYNNDKDLCCCKKQNKFEIKILSPIETDDLFYSP